MPDHTSAKPDNGDFCSICDEEWPCAIQRDRDMLREALPFVAYMAGGQRDADELLLKMCQTLGVEYAEAVAPLSDFIVEDR